jgi:PmbA protein
LWEEGETVELADSAVKKALSAGATEAEAYVQRINNVSVTFQDKIENIKTVESTGIGLSVAVGKKNAIYSTSILDEKEIDEAAKKAVKIAKVASEDSRWKHFNKQFGKTSVEGCYDKKLENPDYKEITETLISAVSCMKDFDKRVRPTRSFLFTALENVSVANSYRESIERRATEVVVYLTSKVEEAGMNSTGAENQQARTWKEIRFDDLATRAAEQAVKYLKAKVISSTKMPVIIRNQIFANLLGIFLSGPINADWVQKGRSPMAGKLGKQVASQNVKLIDDGTMPGGFSTRPFDDEGHPTQRTPIIEKGVLKNYLYDNYTAMQDNVESTGNATKGIGYWTRPQPTPSNLILKPEKTPLEEIIQATEKGLYVEQTIGEWLSNPVSGNLNATVTHGFLIENGKETQPVNGVIIAANFHELLMSGIQMIGNDPRSSIGLGAGATVYSPTIKLAELTIAGK